MKPTFYTSSKILLVSLLVAFAQAANAQYCTPAYENECSISNDYINNITFNSLSNIGTGCNGNDNNYINYVPAGSLTTSLESNASYSITLLSGIEWPQGFGVWIDFNNDNDFDDADEFVYASPSAGTSQFTGSITIPSDPDFVGDHRMRVRCKYNSIIYSNESCTTFNYGETEDYTVSIIPATTNMTYLSSTVTQTNLAALSLGEQDAEIIGIQVVTLGSVNPFDLTSFTINSNGSTNFVNDVDAVKVYYTGSSPVFSSDQLFAIVTDLSLPIVVNATLVSGVNYFWIGYDISADAFPGDDLDAECTQIVMTGSGGTQIPTITAPAGFREINYCFPTYVNSCTSEDFVDNVTFNTLSNLGTGCNDTVNNYIYYPPSGNLTTTVEIGSNYTITLQAGQAYNQGFGVWIDFNNDLDFADADEFVYSSPYAGIELFVGNVSIPNNTAYLGDHRMRIRCIYNNVPLAGDYCNEQQFGETEDYTITITPSTSMVYLSSTTTQNNTNDVLIGAIDQDIIGVEVVTSGSISPFNFTSLTINSTGTTNFAADVSNVKVYYTGADPGFSTGTLFGSATNLSNPITGNVTLVSGVNHLWVTYDISPSASIGNYLDAGCTQVVMTGPGGTHIPAITAPAGNRQVGYCTASSTFGCGFYFIDDVTLNTLSNVNTGCNGALNGYIKHPATGTTTTTLELGITYLLSLEGPEFSPVGFGVWIDYNNDGDFDDVDEFVYTSPFYTTGIQTGEITIPNNASILGERRMRVREKDYNTVFDYESCTEFFYGETEDYTINISVPTTMTYASGTTFQNNLNDVTVEETDAEMMSIQIVTNGSIDPIDVFAFHLSSNGSTNFPNDVSNVKMYATGSSPVFSTATLFGSSQDLATPVFGAATLNTGNNYFWVTYDIAATATLGHVVDVECNQIEFTGVTGTKIPSVTAPAGNREVGYCTASSTYGCTYYYIDDVVLNTLSNINSECNGAANGYTKYPASGSTTTSLEIGSSYAISLEGPVFDPVGFGVWIDFNNDGDFDDADEFVFSSQDYELGIHTGVISVPDNVAYLGDRRMRVREKDYSIVLSNEACSQFFYGETEDYVISIVPATTMSFSSVTAFQNNLSEVQLALEDAEILGIKIQTNGSVNPFALTSVTFNSNGTTDFANDVTGVNVYYSGSNPDFSMATLFGSAANLTSPITGSVTLTGGLNYFWLAYDISSTAALGNVIDAECISVSLSGAGGIHVPDVTAPPGSREINYCVGTYVNLCSSNDYIHNFTFNTLSNLLSGCNGNTDNYIYYDPTGNFTTSVILGGTYNLTIQTDSFWAQGFGVWIDFNNDASFNGADEFVYASPGYSIDLFTGTVIIPNNLSYTGQRRMRVRCLYNTTMPPDGYCSGFNYGETEDYTITIDPQPACTGVPEPGILTITPDEFCVSGTTADLTLTNYPIASDITFEWQQSPNGTNWDIIPGVTNYLYTTPALSATSCYRVKVTCTNTGASSFTNTACITLVPVPDAPQAADGIRCGPGTVQLTANGSGGNLFWYDQLTGGNYLGAGSPFTTPFISAATTFYVEESVGTDCASLRTPVQATLYYPDIATGVITSPICEGETVNLNAQNNGQGTFNYQWNPVLPGMIPANGQAASVTVPPSVTTTFTVTATEQSGQCDTSAEVLVVVLPAPAVQLTGLNNIYQVVDLPVTLTGTPAGGAFSGQGVTGNVFDPAAAGIGGPYVISYSYTDVNGCVGVDTVHVTVTYPIGINDPLTDQSVNIYPNPGEGLFLLDIRSSTFIRQLSYKVINVVGQVMFEKTLNPDTKLIKETFDFSQWSKGTYYFEINADGQLMRKKLVIQ